VSSARLKRDLIAPLCQAPRHKPVVIRSEGAVHDLDELSLEAAQSLSGRLVLGNLAAVVLLAKSRVHHLDARGEMERIVQRAIPGQASRVTPTRCATQFTTTPGYERLPSGFE
jgi:hypothetical protein